MYSLREKNKDNNTNLVISKKIDKVNREIEKAKDLLEVEREKLKDHKIKLSLYMRNKIKRLQNE